jgi:surface antigen
LPVKAGSTTQSPTPRFKRSLFKKSKKRILRHALLITNIIILVGVFVFVIHQGNNSQSVNSNALSATQDSQGAVNPLDKLSSADIAVHVAELTNLYEARAVKNNADTINLELSLAPTDNTVVAKPQIVNTASKTRKDIRTYTTVSGDTISKLADKFGVSSDSIRWSNNLSSDAIKVGSTLAIPPEGVNGIVYTVKNGDSIDALVQKYHADKNTMITFNDAEIGGITTGEQILIPNGVVIPPAAAKPFIGSSFNATYGSNGYDYGYCTWWAALRRQQMGKPLPSNLGNASTWKVYAQLAGFSVSNKPQPGAVIWYPPHDYYGHVGFVESVGDDGTVNTSEMNVVGWNRVSYRTLSPEEAAQYSYIY